MKPLLEEVDLTAVFVAGDFMAFGVMNEIQEKGLKIPDDISVIDFDDIAMAKVMNSPLTTINQATYDKGRPGVELLVTIRKLWNFPVKRGVSGFLKYR